MSQLRTTTFSILIVVSAVAGATLLPRIGKEAWIPRPSEILDAPPLEAVYGSVWLLAVAVAAWLVGSAVLSVCVYVTRIPAAIRAVEWVTVGPIQRLARRIAAAILALSSLSAGHPVGAALLPPIPVAASEHEAGMGSRSEESAPPEVSKPWFVRSIYETRSVSSGVSEPEGRIGISLPTRIRSGLGAGTVAGEYTTYVVQPGDSIWSVSSRHAERNRSGPVPISLVIEVWRQVVELNRDRIRSGDPDLIHPGEMLLLPEPPLLDGR